MSDFSKSPLDLLIANQQKGYVGIHIEQGVPLLDRDLNLLHDLVAATVRSVITHYVGSGLATGSDGFAILPAQPNPSPTDFVISKGAGSVGTCLVGGIEVAIIANATYTAQPQANLQQAQHDGLPLPPALTTPAANRVDTVYLDVWLSEVDGVGDPDLRNTLDVGMETAVRVKPFWLVRVAEGAPVPAPPAGHAFFVLALLNRTAATPPIDANTIQDQRQTRLTMSDIERRLRLMEEMLLLPSFVPATQAQFFPQEGIVNQPIQINGSNFTIGKPAVKFGNVTAQVVNFTATQISVLVPPGVTSGASSVDIPLTVTTQGGSVISDQQFTVDPDPVFDATKPFDPAAGKAGDNITLKGFNLNTPPLKVMFGAVTANNIVGAPTPTQVVAKVPTGLLQPGQASTQVKITVSTGGGLVTTTTNFNVTS